MGGVLRFAPRRRSRPIWLRCVAALNMGRPITVRHTGSEGDLCDSLRRLRKRRPEWEYGAAGVGAPMLCLCTTLGQDGLTARLLVVQSESAVGVRTRCCSDGEHQSSEPPAVQSNGRVHDAANFYLPSPDRPGEIYLERRRSRPSGGRQRAARAKAPLTALSRVSTAGVSGIGVEGFSVSATTT